MTQKFEKVPVRGMTAEEVLALWQEGKLYQEVAMPTSADLQKRCLSEVLAYVMRLRAYVCEPYLNCYDKIWRQVIESPLFEDKLLFKQGSKRGHCNTYLVHSIVCLMREFGLYNQTYTMLQLHLILSQRDKQGAEYKAISGRYALEREQRLFIRSIFNIYPQTTFRKSRLEQKA